MPASAVSTKPRARKRAAKRTSEQLLPVELQELQESIERLRRLELPEEDGEPLETDYHRVQIALLDEVVRQHLGDTNDLLLRREHALCEGVPAVKCSLRFLAFGSE